MGGEAHQCLWFLRPDFYPKTVDQNLRILKYIERYGDRTAYRKASLAGGAFVARFHESSMTGRV